MEHLLSREGRGGGGSEKREREREKKRERERERERETRGIDSIAVFPNKTAIQILLYTHKHSSYPSGLTYLPCSWPHHSFQIQLGVYYIQMVAHVRFSPKACLSCTTGIPEAYKI
jgi:hypothetical protein